MTAKGFAIGGMFLTLAVAWLADPGQEHDPTRHHSPYAGQQPSGIAALTLQELDDLRDGAGMGLARAAELHHYPGPKHVLELASELELSDEQRIRIEEIHAGMLEKARTLGASIIDKETVLDRRFAHRHIDETALGEMTLALGRLYGELRSVHLAAHLSTAAVLTAGQIDAYDRLRGYVPTKEP